MLADVKSEVIGVRITPETIAEIDDWRRIQADIPSRAEAIRRLVMAGLAVASPVEPGTTSFKRNCTL
jgi:hypothetical protein